MRRLIFAVISAIVAALFTFSACSEDGAFRFLSVRLKGGEGKIRAVAINEFTLGPSTTEVTLTLYYSATPAESFENMDAVESVHTPDLDIGRQLVIETDAAEGYYCAQAQYTVGDELRYLVSEIILYNAEGDRIQN